MCLLRWCVRNWSLNFFPKNIKINMFPKAIHDKHYFCGTLKNLISFFVHFITIYKNVFLSKNVFYAIVKQYMHLFLWPRAWLSDTLYSRMIGNILNTECWHCLAIIEPDMLLVSNIRRTLLLERSTRNPQMETLRITINRLINYSALSKHTTAVHLLSEWRCYLFSTLAGEKDHGSVVAALHFYGQAQHDCPVGGHIQGQLRPRADLARDGVASHRWSWRWGTFYEQIRVGGCERMHLVLNWLAQLNAYPIPRLPGSALCCLANTW